MASSTLRACSTVSTEKILIVLCVGRIAFMGNSLLSASGLSRPPVRKAYERRFALAVMGVTREREPRHRIAGLGGRIFALKTNRMPRDSLCRGASFREVGHENESLSCGDICDLEDAATSIEQGPSESLGIIWGQWPNLSRRTRPVVKTAPHLGNRISNDKWCPGRVELRSPSQSAQVTDFT